MEKKIHTNIKMCIVIKKYTLLFWQLFNWCDFESEVSSKSLVITVEELQWIQSKNENVKKKHFNLNKK